MTYPDGDGLYAASGRQGLRICANWSERYAQLGRICQTDDRRLLSFFAEFQESSIRGPDDVLALRASAASKLHPRRLGSAVDRSEVLMSLELHVLCRAHAFMRIRR